MRTPKFRLIASRLMILLAIIVTLVGLGVVLKLVDTHSQPQTVQKPPSPTVPALPSPTPTPTPPLFPALHIVGRQIVDTNNWVVTLIGTNRSSLEYLCTGDGHFQLADYQAMRSWGMNAVRIPLSSEFWSNRGNTCPGYRQTVRTAITNAEQAGLYVMLDLQWNAPFDLADDPKIGGGQYPLPDTGKDVAFWQDIATLYRSDPAVLFDLFGEPHDISWNAWYNGGQVGTQIFEGNHPMGGWRTYQAIGIRDLAAKVRAIAPQNIILISGPDWGFDLSQIPTYPIQLPNILYSTHPFDYVGKEPGDWPAAFGNLSQNVAVIAAEFGSYSCQTGYIAAAIDYFKAHQMSWLAWGWMPGLCGAPSLIENWAGTPISPYGVYIRQHMLAASQAGAKKPGLEKLFSGEMFSKEPGVLVQDFAVKQAVSSRECYE